MTINENEEIEADEEFELAEEVNFEVEFLLDDGATDNQTDEQAASEIRDELFIIYDELNPFEDGETIIEVTIEEIEICEAIDEDPSLSEEDVADEDACEAADETTSTRKKRGLFRRKGKKKKKKKSKVKTWFKSKSKAVAGWGKKQEQKLGDKIVNKTKSSKAVKFLGNVRDTTKNTDKSGVNKLSNSYKDVKTGLNKDGLGFTSLVTKSSSSNSNFKLHNWMGTMPSHMKKLPVTLLAIPGAHEGHTHTMMTSMTRSQDQFTVNGIYGVSQRHQSVIDVFGGVENVSDAWGRCMKPGYDSYKQLELGLRYFEFR